MPHLVALGPLDTGEGPCFIAAVLGDEAPLDVEAGAELDAALRRLLSRSAVPVTAEPAPRATAKALRIPIAPLPAPVARMKMAMAVGLARPGRFARSVRPDHLIPLIEATARSTSRA
jgi:hypothetical protein